MNATSAAQGKTIVAVVPTFNENEELRRVVDSILLQSARVAKIIVVNAGRPLPKELSSHVEEINVDASHYWTRCVNAGLNCALATAPDYVYLTNADTLALPGTLEALLLFAEGKTETIACAPAYQESPEGITLLYSHQDPMAFLLYGRLVRPWKTPGDAPTEPFEIVLTGGQGVLMPRIAVEKFRMDPDRFPQYASDHDLWLTMRESGWRLWVVPQGGVVNTRTLSANRAIGVRAKMSKLLWRMSSELAPESIVVMWRLRRKHLFFPVAALSTLVSFFLRWTIGFPKILRRT